MPRLNLTYENVLGFFNQKPEGERKLYLEFLARDLKQKAAAGTGRGPGRPPGSGKKPAPLAAVPDALTQNDALDKAAAGAGKGKGKKKKPGPKAKKKGAAAAAAPAAPPNGQAGVAAVAPPAAPAPVEEAPPVEE